MMGVAQNAKDSQVLPDKGRISFEQMLENAIQSDAGEGHPVSKRETSKSYLKRKQDKYDPRQSITSNKGGVSSRNIEKKRVFKSKNKGESGDEASGEEDNVHNGSVSENKSTFKNVPRKSFV